MTKRKEVEKKRKQKVKEVKTRNEEGDLYKKRREKEKK